MNTVNNITTNVQLYAIFPTKYCSKVKFDCMWSSKNQHDPIPYILMLHYGVHLDLNVCIERFDTIQLVWLVIILGSNAEIFSSKKNLNLLIQSGSGNSHWLNTIDTNHFVLGNGIKLSHKIYICFLGCTNVHLCGKTCIKTYFNIEITWL